MDLAAVIGMTNLRRLSWESQRRYALHPHSRQGLFFEWSLHHSARRQWVRAWGVDLNPVAADIRDNPAPARRGVIEVEADTRCFRATVQCRFCREADGVKILEISQEG